MGPEISGTEAPVALTPWGGVGVALTAPCRLLALRAVRTPSPAYCSPAGRGWLR